MAQEIPLADIHPSHDIGPIPYEVAYHCKNCFVCLCHDHGEKLLRECMGEFLPYIDVNNNNN